MSNRETILTQLKEDFKNITINNGYNTELSRVERGLYSAEEVYERPFLCFANYSTPKIEEVFGGRVRRNLTIAIVGYINVTLGNIEALDKFSADIQKFLYCSHNTFYEDTTIGDILYFEGSKDNVNGAVYIEIEIAYDYAISDP